MGEVDEHRLRTNCDALGAVAAGDPISALPAVALKAKLGVAVITSPEAKHSTATVFCGPVRRGEVLALAAGCAIVAAPPS
jgi:hypothetical protein